MSKFWKITAVVWQITAVVLHLLLFLLTTFVIALLVIITLETTITFLSKEPLFMKYIVCPNVQYGIWLVYLYKTQNIDRLFGPPIHFQKKDRKHIIFTILTTCIMMVMVATLMYIKNKYLPQNFEKIIIPSDVDYGFYVGAVIGVGINLTISVCLAPFTEELLFRGFLYNRLYTITTNRWLATLISAILFSLMHYSREANNFTYFIHFIQGCFLSFIYAKTNHIIYPIAAHAINNLIAVLLNLFLSIQR